MRNVWGISGTSSNYILWLTTLTLSFKGVDFPDVEIVCNAGLPSSIADALQRAGRVGRRDGSKGLFVIFYEPWAQTVSLAEFNNGN